MNDQQLQPTNPQWEKEFQKRLDAPTKYKELIPVVLPKGMNTKEWLKYRKEKYGS